MKRQVLFLSALVLGISSLTFAQTKTITNADLEKYRQKRLAAERELRENYREMGFPSPEEMERQNEKDRKETAELSQRLRQQRIEREALKNSNYQNNNQNLNQTDYSYPNPNFVDYGQYRTSTYIYPNIFNRRFFRPNNRRNFRRGNQNRRRGRINLNNRRNNRNNLILRTDRRLNRIQRIQTRRGNRNLVLGVGVVRGTRGS